MQQKVLNVAGEKTPVANTIYRIRRLACALMLPMPA